MYMARNDIEGLTKELGNAAAASAVFNDKTGEFDIATKEMHKLKIIAEQTGISYDELITSAKNMKKFSMLETQLRFGMSDEDKEFLTSRAVLNEKGEGEIMINGNPKLLKQLSEQDIKILKSQAAEQQNMKKRAEQSRTFDETISDIFNKLKISLLPFVKALNDELVPKLQKLAERFDSEGWGEKIEKFAGSVGEIVSSIASFVMEWPKTTAALLLFSKVGPAIFSGLSFLWDTVKWFKNGIQLGMGFNSVASPGDGSGTLMDIDGDGNSGGKNRRPSRKGFKGRLKPKMPKGVGGWGGAALGALALGMDAYGQYGEQKEAGMSTGENTTKTATSTAGRAGGMWAGAALGAELGLLGGPLAWITSPLGALIGGAAGYFGGDWLAGKANDSWGKKPMTEVHDGIIGSPIHDGFLNGMSGTILGGMLGGGMLGSDFSKGRGVIQGGKITPIDNKDDLLAMKPGGIIDKTLGKSSTNVVKHDFGEIRINGEIKVTSPGNPGIAVDLMKDPQFKRDITRTIQSELQKNKIGGKNRG
jgi:hypothetical protein